MYKLKKFIIRKLIYLVVILGRKYKREYLEAILWGALNRDGRKYTDDQGYETINPLNHIRN